MRDSVEANKHEKPLPKKIEHWTQLLDITKEFPGMSEEYMKRIMEAKQKDLQQKIEALKLDA